MIQRVYLPFNVERFHIFPPFVELDLGGLYHVDLSETRQEKVFGHSTHASSTIQNATMPDLVLVFVNESSRSVNIREMHLPIPAKHPIYGCLLRLPARFIRGHLKPLTSQ